MRYKNKIGIAVAVIACMAMGIAISAQNDRGQYYSRAQIEQFVAPVALYPDALLAQVFMAATYPGEVVEASRWTERNSRLRGDSLAEALDDRDWDVSVKSLVPFPDVLSRMAENEAWTQDLGNAFLIQPDDVTDAVQNLRHRAYEAGNLRTSPQQRVVYDRQYIQIVPVSVDIIYVPAYNPMEVYGRGWGYPTYYYPAMMAPPSYYRPGSAISFSLGFSVGFSLFGAFDWGQHSVYYGPNFYQYRGYHRYAQDWRQHHSSWRPGDRGQWAHEPSHRGPGGYHNEVLDHRFGGGHESPRGDSAHGGMPPPVPGPPRHAPPTKGYGSPRVEPATRHDAVRPVQPIPRMKPQDTHRNDVAPRPAGHPTEPAQSDKHPRSPKGEQKKGHDKK